MTENFHVFHGNYRNYSTSTCTEIEGIEYGKIVVCLFYYHWITYL